jgi:hypothetical protein
MRSRYSLSVLAAALILVAGPAGSTPRFGGKSVHYITGIFLAGSAAGDFDGDGHLDYALVVSNPDGTVQTARGHGDGTFDPVQTMPGNVYGAPVAADLNGDGYSDFAVSGNNGLAIRYGGPSGLGPATSLVSGTDLARQMAVGDVNGDGRLDLVTADTTDIVVHLATGPMTYAPDLKSPIGLVGPIYDVVMGDVDEDGKPDLFIETTANVVAWMKGRGDGTFDPASPVSIPSNGYAIFLADLNGDHHLDVITYEGWSPGDGHGNFGPPVTLGFPIYGAEDVTGDGAPDLIVQLDNLGLNGQTMELYRNDGSGNFTLTWSQPFFYFSLPSFADFNGDGFNDLLVGDDIIGNISVHLSNGDGTFGSEKDYITGNHPSGIVLAEVTGDGLADVITSNQADGTISVLPGLPGGKFDSPIAHPVGTSPAGIATGDLNGDGRPDIVTANSGSNSVSVLLGQAGGGLGSAVSTPAGTAPMAVAVADMDRDGHPDVVVVGGGSCTVLGGDGTGGLHFKSSRATSGGPVSLAVGDLDGDGWPDVVVTAPGYVDVLRGDGTGGLLPKVTYLGGGGTSVSIADVTGDGIPDVVAVARISVFVFKGTGGGALSMLPAFRVGQNRAASVVDGNGDGKLDLFIAANNANCVWFLPGLGDGTFGPAEGYGTERGPNGLAVADLNGDGVLDVVTCDGDTNFVSVILGTPSQPVPALATLVSAEATMSGVRIEWLAGSTGSLALVERSENGAAFVRVGQIAPDASGQITFEDPHVKQGSDYVYRLGFDRSGQTVYAGLVSVHVPVSATLSLAPGSNPALGSFNVSFSLPDTRPARLELYDVSGRRLLAREVGAMGPGAHVLRLGETSGLSSGVYWLRLVHPTKTLVARAALVR